MADQVPGDLVCVLVSSGRSRVDLDMVGGAVVQVLELPTGPSLGAIGSPALPLFQDLKIAMDANVAKTVAVEDGEGVSNAIRMTIGQYPVDDKVETLIGEASDRSMEGPAHGDGKTAVCNVVGKVRKEAVCLDVEEGPPGQRELPQKRPGQCRLARTGGPSQQNNPRTEVSVVCQFTGPKRLGFM